MVTILCPGPSSLARRIAPATFTPDEPPITTPGVRSRADNDLYVNLLAFAQDGSTATLNVIVEPLVVWIWIGSFIVAFGALVSMWPRRRRSAFTAVPREQAYATAEAA